MPGISQIKAEATSRRFRGQKNPPESLRNRVTFAGDKLDLRLSNYARGEGMDRPCGCSSRPQSRLRGIEPIPEGRTGLAGQTVMIDNDFLTPRELAKIIRFSEVGVRRLIAERRIAVVRIGRRVLVPRSELERLIEHGYRPARHEREPPRR